MRATLLISIILLLSSCVASKSRLLNEEYEKENTVVVDTSKIVSKIDLSKQYVDTQTKERIVTYYKLRVDTVYDDNGNANIVATPYKDRVEEDRSIDEQKYIYQLAMKDSINNALMIENERLMELLLSEKKETETGKGFPFYILVLIGLVIVLLYILFANSYNKKFK